MKSVLIPRSRSSALADLSIFAESCALIVSFLRTLLCFPPTVAFCSWRRSYLHFVTSSFSFSPKLVKSEKAQRGRFDGAARLERHLKAWEPRRAAICLLYYNHCCSPL